MNASKNIPQASVELILEFFDKQDIEKPIESL